MELSRRNFLQTSAFAGLAGGCTARSGSGTTGPDEPFLVDLKRQPDDIFPLWPEGAPGGTDQPLEQRAIERPHDSGLRNRALVDITDPTLSVFRSEAPNGMPMLLMPGGGYQRVVVDNEGYEGARYFSRHGFDVYVMSYRLPHHGWTAGPDAPLQDAQRALRLVRAQAGATRSKVMVTGFSAGGHLAGSLSQRFDDTVYDAVDEADALSCRPDLSVLIYPVALMGSEFSHKGSQDRLLGETPDPEDLLKYDLSTAPNPQGPPVFLLHALDDTSVPVENALVLARRYREAGVEAVLHTFASGGHGFGLRGITNTPLQLWPRLVMDWARAKI